MSRYLLHGLDRVRRGAAMCQVNSENTQSCRLRDGRKRRETLPEVSDLSDNSLTQIATRLGDTLISESPLIEEERTSATHG
jgi:hypothetical protein